jgi:pyruvate formate lyase activating enzyme
MRQEAHGRLLSALAQTLNDGVIQCRTCEHFCAIETGKAGKCGVRRNIDGALYLVVYGKAVAVHVDPIEKKPLFHFLPRSQALSVGTYGCNFRCTFCQNWQMSQTRDFDERTDGVGRQAPPQALVDLCLEDDVPIIAYTYNEPTVFFEYTYDTAKLAHEHGIKNVYVSNGYMTEGALNMIEPYLDGINVDLKAFSDAFYREQCQARLGVVKRNINHIARETDIWIEVTTLLIPGLNDSPEEVRAMAEWLVGVRPDMPWHITAFHPDHEMLDRPRTSSRALNQAYDIAREVGLQYVYVGNVMDVERESTNCPQCGETLIRRHWYHVEERWREPGVCPHCGQIIAGVWE